MERGSPGAGTPGKSGVRPGKMREDRGGRGQGAGLHTCAAGPLLVAGTRHVWSHVVLLSTCTAGHVCFLACQGQQSMAAPPWEERPECSTNAHALQSTGKHLPTSTFDARGVSASDSNNRGVFIP